MIAPVYASENVFQFLTPWRQIEKKHRVKPHKPRPELRVIDRAE